MSIPKVLLDACVLYPAQVRSLFMYLASTDLFLPRWTDRIHDEWTRNLLRNHPQIPIEKAQRNRDLMNAHVPDCLITDFEAIETSLDLPDPNDHHILAAAIHGEVSTIVTFNITDFPIEKLTPVLPP